MRDRLKRAARWVKENPDYAAYLVASTVAGVVLVKQHKQILKLQKRTDWYARELDSIIEPMRDGYAARLDFKGDKIIFFESAPRALMDQYFSPK